MKKHSTESLTNLADFLGTTLKYGDKVVFCDPGESRKCLEHGTVVGFTNKRIYVVFVQIIKYLRNDVFFKI